MQLASCLSLSPSSLLSKAIIITVAFTLSGIQHAFALYATSRSGRLTLIFFLLQPLGIAFESAVAHNVGWNKWIGYVWTAIWLLTTSSIYFDDLVRAGLFNIDAAPVSLVRALTAWTSV